MHWLAELLGILLHWFIPSNSSHADRSQVGESRLDREARWIGIAVFVAVVLVVAALLYLRS